MLRGLELSDGFQGKGFKGSARQGAAGCMISSHTVLRLVGIKVKFRALSFNQPRVYVLVVSSFHLEGVRLEGNQYIFHLNYS